MNSDAIKLLAAKVPLFSGLSTSDLAALAGMMVRKEFAAGEVIVQEEEEGQTFFVINSGVVHVAVMTPEGKNTVLATLKRGEFFGEMTLLDGEPRSASVIAAQDCDLFLLYRRVFHEILHRFPKIAVHLLTEMSKRLRRANHHINTLSMMSVYGRVADVLVQLANDQGIRAKDMILIYNRPTHQTIANMAGTSRETVSRILSQLQKKRYIAIDGKKLVILNEKKLYD
jgi:CRP/FNR family transcriptional regulator/CRP/FNR family cyclic AMP-dependent transcriptional regulator